MFLTDEDETGGGAAGEDENARAVLGELEQLDTDDGRAKARCSSQGCDARRKMFDGIRVARREPPVEIATAKPDSMLVTPPPPPAAALSDRRRGSPRATPPGSSRVSKREAGDDKAAEIPNLAERGRARCAKSGFPTISTTPAR